MDATDFAAALPRLQSLLGLAAFCAIAWGFSEARDRFPWRMALGAVGVQIALAALFLYAPGTRDALAALNVVIETLQVASEAGTTLVFGHLGGGPAPFTVTDEGALFNLAFRGLPLVIFMSALAALLWHLGVLRLMIGALAAGLERAFGVGGAVALAASANVLLGQTEAPLLIRAYLNKLTRSEFFVVLAGGLATVAGTVMVLYALILAPVVPAALGHILLASIISAPAAILMARIIVPPDADETPTPTAAGSDLKYAGALDAFMTGVTEGLKLYLNIIASLIAFVALAKLINLGLAGIGEVAGEPLTLERMLGWLFAPIAWLTGVPFAACADAGALIGVKTALNELVAYVELARAPDDAFDERTRMILVYALCGFANIGSLGILTGGFTAIAPERRGDVVALAPKALVAGTLATMMTGAVIGLIWTP